ncbi:unnamed protein product, partial [Ascophyllum nodosum]
WRRRWWYHWDSQNITHGRWRSRSGRIRRSRRRSHSRRSGCSHSHRSGCSHSWRHRRCRCRRRQ